MPVVRIRPAHAGDRDFILDLVPRLVESGGVPGRDTAQLVARDRAVLASLLERSSDASAVFDDSAVFVAENDDGRAIGFLHLTTVDDYYSNRAAGHIADVVVSHAAGGAGAGSGLIAFAEAWARERGYALLTLNVFTENHRARALYKRLGFEEEWIRCVKRL